MIIVFQYLSKKTLNLKVLITIIVVSQLSPMIFRFTILTCHRMI